MLITTQSELDSFCENLKDEQFITVDTEFLREKTYYPQLCLIQISGKDKKAAAIDPLADIDLAPVFELMVKPDILKVFHAGRQDFEIFFKLMGELPAPIFDTQIAAMVCGFGDQIGYERLVREVCNIQIDKSRQFTNWARRPLSEPQLDYALSDVTHLVDIYYALSTDLEKRGRTEWVFEEEAVLTNPAIYINAPEECWKRIKIRTPSSKTLVVLKALATWREETAQRKNLPKNWIMRDEVLGNMAAQIPTTPDALSKIRNISKDLAKGSKGKMLIDMMQNALKTPQDQWPHVEKKKPLSATNAAKVDMLKLLLKIQAAKHDVAPKLIADTSDLERIVTGDQPKPAALKGWRHKTFGQYASDMINGKIALTMDGDAISVTTIDE